MALDGVKSFFSVKDKTNMLTYVTQTIGGLSLQLEKVEDFRCVFVVNSV